MRVVASAIVCIGLLFSALLVAADPPYVGSLAERERVIGTDVVGSGCR
jgi:hypothetical protein